MTTAHRIVAAAGLAASVAAAHAQTDFSWASPDSDLWTDTQAWTPEGSPGATSSLDTATLALAGPYTVTLDANRTVAAIDIPNPEATLVIASGVTLNLGTLSSSGELILSDQTSTSTTNLSLQDGAVISGMLVLNATDGVASRSRLNAPSLAGQSASIDQNAVVAGAGRLTGNLINHGLVLASGPDDTIEILTSGPLLSTGTVRAANGAFLSINSGIDGGTLDTDAASRASSGTNGIAGATLEGTLVIASGDSLTLAPGNTYNGEIVVSDQTSTSTTNLNLQNGATLSGLLTLNATGAVASRSRLNGPTASGQSATIDQNALVTGAGRLTGFLVNHGLVLADGPDSTIAIWTSGPLLSTGTVRAVNGAFLDLSSGLDGGTIDTDADSRASSSSIGIANATLEGTLVIPSGDTLTLNTGNTFNGEIIVNDQATTSTSNLSVRDTATVSGIVTLNAPGTLNTRARLSGPTGTGQSATVETDALITGNGRLLGQLINHGTILADGPDNTIVILTSGPLLSTGTVRASGGANLSISSGLVGGTLDGDDLSRVDSGSTGIADADLTGTIVVASGDTLTLRDGNTYSGEIVVNDQSTTSSTSINLQNEATIGGTVTLNAAAGSPIRARLSGPFGTDESASITPDALVTGNGRLAGRLINHGLVLAAGPGNAIEIQTSGPLLSTGTVRALDGARLPISSGLVGGTLDGDADSRVNSGSAGVINTNLTGDIVIASGDTLVLGTGNTYSGEIVINDQTSTSATDLDLRDEATIGGTITLNAPDGSPLRARLRGPFGADESAAFTPDAVLRGNGRLNGAFEPFGATLAPGTPDARGVIELQNSGDFILTDAATVEIGIEGDDPGEHDLIANSGPLHLDGTLVITPLNGFIPSVDNPFVIIEGGTITGSFEEIVYNGPLGPNRVPRLFYNAGTVTFALVCVTDFAPPIGVVDIFDLLTFLDRFEQQDPDADLAPPFGVWDIFDILTFLQIFADGCE